MREEPARDRGTVLVAMSGGVDSSVAAALLLERGYNVIGCFMRLGSPGETLDEPVLVEDAPACTPSRIGHRGCCSVGDAADARLVAAHLGIPLYVCNFKKDFSRIIDYFVDEYASGRTPNPCVRCNDWLKFGKLHEYARQIGAQHVASGHYARIEPTDDGPALKRGLDRDKDQSYVLFGVGRERLEEMMLPIGEFRKAVVRDLARERGLPVHDKPDSQEICFVPDDNYARLVEERRPELAERGEIVDTAGNVVGEHRGQHRFTVGQRRGIGTALGYPIYVIERDAGSNRVTVGAREQLEVRGCVASEANWLIPEFEEWTPCLAQCRYQSEAAPASVRSVPISEAETPSGRRGGFEVRFETARTAVAPGQAVVLYDRHDAERVVAGGWILTTSH